MKCYLYPLITALFLLPLSIYADDKGTDYVLTNITPEENSVLDGFSKGDSITFNTNFDAICGGFYERIVDNDSKTVLYSAFNSVKNDKGEWVLKFYEDVKLYQGHTYSLEIEGHEVADSKSGVVGKVSVNYVGNTIGDDEGEDDSGYEFSDIEYLYFSPRDGAEMNNPHMSFVIVEYTGDVKIDRERSKVIEEDGNILPFENFVTLYKKEDIWQMFIPSDVLLRSTSEFRLHIYTRDKQDRVVKGNRGKGENSYYELTYRCSLGYPELTVSPFEGKYNDLSNFSFTCDGGIDIKDDSKDIYLLGEDKSTIVQTIKGSDLLVSDNNSKEYYYQLEDSIKEEGVYYLHVPEGLFALGNKSLDNRDTWVRYNIVNKQGFYGVTLDPAEGSELTSLSTINISFDDWDVVVPYYGNPEKITVTNEAGEIVTYGSASFDENRSQNNICIIKLNTTVKAPGEYTLNIPANAFFLGKNAESTSIPMSFGYTIVEEPDMALNPDIMTEMDENHTLRYIHLSFKEFNYVTLMQDDPEIILTDTLGQMVAKGILKLATGKRNLCVEIEPEYQVSAPGDYILIIPSGLIKFNSVVYNKELHLLVPFDPTSDIQLAAADNDNQEWVKVYNIQGQLVREGKACEAFVGLKGLYIVNGKKMYIKSAFSK